MNRDFPWRLQSPKIPGANGTNPVSATSHPKAQDVQLENTSKIQDLFIERGELGDLEKQIIHFMRSYHDDWIELNDLLVKAQNGGKSSKYFYMEYNNQKRVIYNHHLNAWDFIFDKSYNEAIIVEMIERELDILTHKMETGEYSFDILESRFLFLYTFRTTLYNKDSGSGKLKEKLEKFISQEIWRSAFFAKKKIMNKIKYATDPSYHAYINEQSKERMARARHKVKKTETPSERIERLDKQNAANRKSREKIKALKAQLSDANYEEML